MPNWLSDQICWTKGWFTFQGGWNQAACDVIILLRTMCNFKLTHVSGIFQLIFLDHGWLLVTEAMGSETTDIMWDYCTFVRYHEHLIFLILFSDYLDGFLNCRIALRGKKNWGPLFLKAKCSSFTLTDTRTIKKQAKPSRWAFRSKEKHYYEIAIY